MRINLNKGFTLIELSTVLVIIGLLIASVLAGQAMIEQTRLISIIKDAEKYKNAVGTFRQKYNAWPGDMVDAGTEWPGCSAPSTDCNGNGNENITGTGTDPDERYRFWQHLNLAEMIKGSYTGTVGGGAALGVNVPASKIKNGGFFAEYEGNLAKNSLRFGGTSSASLNGSVLNSVDAQTLDEKTDDGIAFSGMVIGYNGTDVVTGCLTGANGTTDYKLDNIAIRCKLYFLMNF